MMGFTGGSVLSPGLYGDANQNPNQPPFVLVDQLACAGSEVNLTACSYNVGPRRTCTHAQDVAIECMGGWPPRPGCEQASGVLRRGYEP